METNFYVPASEYSSILNTTVPFSEHIILQDHLGGFDKQCKNTLLEKLNKLQQNNDINVTTEYIFNDLIKSKYKNLCFNFSSELVDEIDFKSFKDYNIHPEINLKNFVCSFNGSAHDSRLLLTAILNNQGIFNPEFSSKNFSYSNDWIIGHLEYLDLSDSEIELYERFFKNSDKFNNKIYSFGHVQYNHGKNIYNLENRLTQSFLHIVSETMATSYYPYYSEKFLYSVVTRGLFLSYAQPMWHQHLEKYYGFKKYNKIFNYDFDLIKNPVKRLIRLIEMVSKFKNLPPEDWRDLYLMEQDTIEYNYDHYFSGNYLKHLAQFE